MDPDLALIIGLVLGVLSLPAAISATSEKRVPRVAGATAVASVVLVLWAINRKPGGYSFTEIPDAFIRVVAMLLP